MTNKKPPVLDAITMERVVMIDYTNHRGERTDRRRVLPIRWFFGEDPTYHPKPQWIMVAWDFTKKDYRNFAMDGLHGWKADDAD